MGCTISRGRSDRKVKVTRWLIVVFVARPIGPVVAKSFVYIAASNVVRCVPKRTFWIV